MVSREEDHHQWPIKLGSHCHLSPRKFHCASSESSRSFKQVLIVCVCSTAIDLNTPESNLGDTVWRWWCPSAPSGLAGLALYIEIIMIVSLISGLQVHDTCNSEELTQKHLYNIISTTREAASVLNLKRPEGPPLLGKSIYRLHLGRRHKHVHSSSKIIQKFFLLNSWKRDVFCEVRKNRKIDV